VHVHRRVYLPLVVSGGLLVQVGTVLLEGDKLVELLVLEQQDLVLREPKVLLLY